MPDLLASITPALQPMLGRGRWLVGYSGGLDSTVLLHLLSRFVQQRQAPPALLAIHIHHGLSPNAQRWQQSCETFCRQHGIPLQCQSIALPRNPRGGLEAAAREARYAAIDDLRQGDDVLFLGHHLDDQLETLVLNLFRSRGIAGLAGMAATSHPAALRARPLLQHPRSELLDYARQHELTWVEDESNAELRFSRGFVRHRLLPMAASHWTDYSSRLDATQREFGYASELLDEVAAADLQVVCKADRWGQYLEVAAMQALSPARARNLVRLWLHRFGVPTLRQRQWQVFFSDLLANSGTATLALRGGSLRRYRQALYFVAGADLAGRAAISAWDGYQRVGLGASGVLRWSPAQARGLDPRRAYRVVFRAGGEVLQPFGSAHSVSLKRLLQERGVPPWWRSRVPLLVCNGELAAVADLAVASRFLIEGSAGAAQLVWEPQGTPS
jgi:tRNA(Ile)-lysidine synthase